MRPTLKTLTAAILLAGLSTAHAMPYSQLVIFGDSLSDSGQFPDAGSPLLFGNPTGGLRFTNRTGPGYADNNSEYYAQVSTQRLATQLGLQALPSTPILPQALTGNADGTNYAVGGYRTDQILGSIVDTNGSVVDTGLGLSRTRNGYLVDVPRVDPNALFYINGGGNDVLQGVIVDQTTASASAADLVAGVAALQAAGARYIIVSDLPDVGLTPAGFASGQRSAFSAAAELFNTELASQLGTLGGNVIRLNVRGLLAEVQTDLALYGFDPSVSQSDVCFSGDLCLEDATSGINSATANPDRLLFNDGVHPTAAVQQISADYIYSILAAPWETGLLPEMALGSLTGHQQQLRSEWQSQRNAWQPVGQWQSLVAASGQQLAFQRGEAVAEGDSQGLGLTVGGSYRLDANWRLGIALGVQDQQLEAGAADSEYDLRSYLLSAFAQYQNGRVWADLGATAGHLDYSDLQRRFALGITERKESGDSEGQLWALSGRLGYDLANADSGWQVSPFVSADLAKITVDGYREQGSSATALDFDEQQRDSRRLGVGVQMNYAVNAMTQVFAEVAREREFEDDPRDLRMGLSSVEGSSFELQGYAPASGQTLASMGISHALAADMDIRATYHWRGTEARQQAVSLAFNWDW
ncbi:outer membrane lipase/esterase [Pseudomonas cuatrocienegasensis]|uniref:Outer membrane lipase/esterase n=1 Tax=Pseudomonas cuatrocienegasensis TaxID=543360 RepID=A0ABY1B637_9PSED|nr:MULTISPECIES: autotransporter domain-containing SGNH/GDSL hydrolase family protein [Pseudomonas]OEC36716.1 autotransporter outer membrane beta-barrel domain-containing protein [Pseudomonas sp. 21C1]SEQ04363.1 outer membrane lipase/esterase [Pseudomonas cuatrocienegasensis]